MGRMWIAAGVMLIATVSARADDAGRLKLARAVVDTAHVADNMRQMLPQMMAQFKPMVMQQGAADSATVDAFFKRFAQRFDTAADRFADLAAEIYAKEFSEDDLSNLLAFYKTPTGQHLLDKQATIAQGMFAVGAQWGQMMAKEVLDDFQKEKAAPPLKP